MEFTKTLFHEKGKHTLTLVEQFVPTASSIHWKIDINDGGEAWSTPIETRLQYPAAAKTRLWTAWADPRRENAGRMNRAQLITAGIVPDVNESGDWADPLVPVDIGNARFWYGALPYTDDRITITPKSKGGEQVFCIPLATLLEVDTDVGLGLILSPEDLLLDMSLTTTEDGRITFSRFFHRLGQGRSVRFAMDLVAHEADWRSALGWMARRYREYFDPPNPKAHQIAGTGAYSSHGTDFDEFTYSGLALNTTSLLGVRKPVLGWTRNEDQLKPDPDAFFQKYLYLGVFPMCPFPGNGHSLRPSAWADQQYLDYGPLMIAMRGRKWVLEPHAVSVPQGNAKANIFEVPSGFVVPVVYAGDAGNIKVVLRSKKVVNEELGVYAIHPGTDKRAEVATSKDGDSLILDVPVKRGCAMVQMLRQ